MAESRLAYLFNKYVSNTCTREELAELWSLLKEVPEGQDILSEEMQGLWNKERSGQQASDTVDWNFLQQRMQAEMKTAQAPVRRVHFMRHWWAAASILLILAAGTFFWFNKEANETTPLVQQPVDIAPGKDGAILTLADGRKVVLDSLGNGTIANERTTRILLKNGQLIYETAQAEMGEEPVYNTMSTPKGRQFQLVLPDGTKAWLNAASSIRYPTFFTGDERRVEITGEVYFEVARSVTASGAKRPFKVNVNDQAQIEVLGTHFNINAYSNEPSVKTTLLEGAVKVSAAGASTILKPGEQAQINTNQTIQTNSQVDLDKVMAWKNGLFNFEETSIIEVMKQLERWYDITVIYEKGVPDIKFFGEMSRNVSLADLIDVLKDVGVRFRIEAGRRLVVLP